jgi:hypothetical protein
LRDIELIRRGAAAAGHRLWVAELPWTAPLIALAALGRLLGVSLHLVISDKLPGDTWLARLFGRATTRMLWNYADEWPANGTRLPQHKVCFFSEPGQDADLFLFAPQPVPARTGPRPRPIVFIGDVSLDCALPQGVEWWTQSLEALRARHGYVLFQHAEFEQLLHSQLESTQQRRLARVFAKNLLRLWIVRETRANFGERLVLVGSNWRKFGLDAEPSSYSVPARLAYFSSAVVNLDCGSKSGDTTLYPRSSELISFAGGLLQARCADAAQVFGDRVGEFCFDDAASLVANLGARVSETAAAREARDQWLRARLGAERLLMQHSIERMLAARRC